MLTTIVTRAVRLSGADGGSIFEFQPGEQVFVLRTCSGTSAELAERLRGTRIALDETFIGRAAARRAAQQAPDLAQEAPDPHIAALLEGGWRSMLAVPLLREDEIIGALIVRRTEPGAFPDRTVELLETLASQSAVAIHNARLYSELARKSGELEVAGRHKSEFLASMSHELRTPLNAVIGFSDVLLERMAGELNERQEEYVVDIRDSGRHLLELINEILDLSKVEAGRMELDPGPLSLPDLLEQGLAMVRERAEPRRARRHAGRRARRRRGLGGRAQAQAGRHQPADQRGQVHPGRRRGRRSRRGSRATRCRSPCATPGSGSPSTSASGSSRPSSAATGPPGRPPRAPGSA